MFYGHCWDCGQRWELGTASTCVCSEPEPVAHCKVRPLRGDESFPKVEIDWVNQPVPGPLYTHPPQRTEQEPVAYPDGDVVGPCICGSWPGGKCLKCPRITTPPQRKPLSDKELFKIWLSTPAETEDRYAFARAVEAAHGIKE